MHLSSFMSLPFVLVVLLLTTLTSAKPFPSPSLSLLEESNNLPQDDWYHKVAKLRKFVDLSYNTKKAFGKAAKIDTPMESLVRKRRMEREPQDDVINSIMNSKFEERTSRSNFNNVRTSPKEMITVPLKRFRGSL